MTKLASSLPKGDANGLAIIARALIEHPHATHVAIAVLDCKKVETDMDSGDVNATARVRRIEVIRATDLATAEQLMRRALEHRTGNAVLPIELEDEINQCFGAVDVTGLQLVEDDEASPEPEAQAGEDDV